jgi:hypothetical protein
VDPREEGLIGVPLVEQESASASTASARRSTRQRFSSGALRSSKKVWNPWSNPQWCDVTSAPTAAIVW